MRLPDVLSESLNLSEQLIPLVCAYDEGFSAIPNFSMLGLKVLNLAPAWWYPHKRLETRVPSNCRS